MCNLLAKSVDVSSVEWHNICRFCIIAYVLELVRLVLSHTRMLRFRRLAYLTKFINAEASEVVNTTLPCVRSRSLRHPRLPSAFVVHEYRVPLTLAEVQSSLRCTSSSFSSNMPISIEQAEELRINVADIESHAENSKQSQEQADVDLEQLAAQLQELQRSSRQFISKHHASDSSYAASSSAYSDDGSQGNDSTGIDTPPTLAASSCPTPTRDSVSGPMQDVLIFS